MFNPIQKTALLSPEQIVKFYTQLGDTPLETGIAYGNNDDRASKILWLHKDEWEWLYTIIEPWVRENSPSDFIYSDPQSDSIQFTRYLEEGFYNWHEDKGDENTRLVSCTVLLSSALEGGELQLRDRPIDPIFSGDSILFPSTIEHRVTPVISGTRDSLVMWLSGSTEEEISEKEILSEMKEIKSITWGLYTTVINQNLTDRSSLFFLTREEAEAGIDYLIRENNLKLPYNMLPGSRPGNWVSSVMTSWKRWKQYQREGLYNPPGFLKHLRDFREFDTNADPCPTWNDLYTAAKEAMRLKGLNNFLRARTNTIERLRIATRDRISLAYGKKNFEEEIFFKLRNEHTAEQDAERDRLRIKHGEIKVLINSTDSLESLELIDFTSDNVWENENNI